MLASRIEILTRYHNDTVKKMGKLISFRCGKHSIYHAGSELEVGMKLVNFGIMNLIIVIKCHFLVLCT